MLQLAPIEDTRTYRELTRLGREEGWEEGREEGRQEGLQKGIRAVLRLRFPHVRADELITTLALVSDVKDEAMLELLLEEATDAASLGNFQQQAREMQEALALLRRRASAAE